MTVRDDTLENWKIRAHLKSEGEISCKAGELLATNLGRNHGGVLELGVQNW